MKIAVLLPNWIGDVVMSTPTLRAIHEHFGDAAEIAHIMHPRMADVLAGTHWCDRTFFYDRRSPDRSMRGLSLLRQLRAWDPDAMVLLPSSLWAGALAWLSGAPLRIGYARNGCRPLLTKPLTPPHDGRKRIPIPTSQYYLRLAAALGCPTTSVKTELATLPVDEAIADRVWKRLQLTQAGRVIVFNTGSAVGSARNWPLEHYVELARRVVDDPQNSVLLICGPAERDSVAHIERAVGHPRVKSMADQDLRLGVAKACVRRSQLMVTTDSGPRHFAPAFDVPVITLFGPTDSRWTDSLHPAAVNLSVPVDCGPCGRTVCPFEHHQCMRELSVDRVHAAILGRLNRSSRRRAA